tara:strand:- start:2917 stop:3096 length:180 start_codon:yes stop_codon:yes gene_type:complete
MEKFTKTDYILLMQILNRAEKSMHFSEHTKKNIPRLFRKVHERLLKMIEKEKNTRQKTD